MNVMTTSTRLAATGAAAALAAAALVGVTTTTANAVPVTNSYSCSNAGLGLGPWDVTLNSDAPGIEGFPEVPAGFDAPGGLLTLTNQFTIPAAAYATLGGAGVEDVSFPDFAGTFGNEGIGVAGMAVTVSGMTDNGNGTYSSDPAEGSGLNEAFSAPAAGTYDVLSPASFIMSATVGASQIPVTCTITGDPGAYASILVVKNASTTSGKPVAKTLKTTKAAKMKVVVAAENQAPRGKVLVKKGKKTLGKGTVKNGKATVNMGKLKKGKYSVKVVYKGDGYTLKSASKKITFKVKR